MENSGHVSDGINDVPLEFSTNSKLPVSCFIITKNEENRIGACIASVIDWLDEVIVIDSGSSDRTVSIAREAGAKVVFNEWPGFGQQKRFGESLCKYHWLINLDADEIASPEFRSEITALFRSGEPALSSYYSPVDIVYPGRDRPRRFAKDHLCIRFYDRRKARFKDSAIHDSVDPGNHQVGHLKGVIYHRTFTSFTGLIAKCDERATYGARHASVRSPLALLLRTAVEWPYVFLKYYFLRRHITAGLDGILYAAIIAYYRQARLVRMLALSRTTGAQELADTVDQRVHGMDRAQLNP